MSASFGKVLVAVDGSPRALRVLEPLRELVVAGAGPRREVTFLRVLGPGEGPQDAQAAEGTLQADLEEARALLGPGVQVRGEVVRGLPAEEIVRYARETGQELVAMAYHGRRLLGRWLLGSVAEEVVRGCEMPVLLLRTAPA